MCPWLQLTIAATFSIQSLALCAAASDATSNTTSTRPFVPTAELPDLLASLDGSAVTAATWPARRDELKSLLEEHILGTRPSDESVHVLAPTVLNATETGALSSRYVRLTFQCGASEANRVSFDVELAWPTLAATRGEALPLFLTQWNHRSWGILGVQRGYMMALYPGADTRDASGDFRAAFPESTFRKIMARAFVASRVLDVLLGTKHPTLPLPAIDHSRVTITGHSRNGKQSLVAAAFDERFTAVVGSSPGTPIAAPVRFSSPDFNGETVDSVNSRRDWWLPSLKSYYGREHELPADGHMVLALIAPRHAMLATAHSDGEGDHTFADEMNVQAATAAFTLLGAPDAIHIKFREGRHHGFIDTHSYFDWFDHSASRPGTAALFPSVATLPLPHTFDWATWRVGQPNATVPEPSAPLAERVKWLMGDGVDAGAVGGLTGGSAYCESGAVGSEWDYKASLMMHDSMRCCYNGSKHRACRYNVTRMSLSFGAYITASLFLPDGVDTSEPLPLVIFLHGYSYQLGYTGIYGLYDSETDGGIINGIAGRGVAVLAWDMTGHGARQTESFTNFYRRFPAGSRLGSMVGEIEAALDFVHCSGDQGALLKECSDGSSHAGPYKRLSTPAFDETRVFLLGYSMGSIVGLHAAALLPKIAGVAAFGGWTPFKANAGNVSTGGNTFLSEKHALLPRLGLFKDQPQDIPYDYAELIAAIAPRPVLLVSPSGDRFTMPAAVSSAAAEAQKAWTTRGAPSNFFFASPDRPSDFKTSEVKDAIAWVEKVVMTQ